MLAEVDVQFDYSRMHAPLQGMEVEVLEAGCDGENNYDNADTHAASQISPETSGAAIRHSNNLPQRATRGCKETTSRENKSCTNLLAAEFNYCTFS